MTENNCQLSYKDVLILAKGCYDLALENYALESYPEILPNQNLLTKAAKLLHSVEEQGYNDHLWCGLLGDILWYMPCCSEASYRLIERACVLSPDFPNEMKHIHYYNF